MDTSGRTVATVPLEGGHLALDFVNTIGGLRDDPPSAADELFVEYEDVVEWCARLGVVTSSEAGALRRAAARDRRAAGRALLRARELRELIYGVFRPLSDGKEPPAELLARLREEEREALASAELARGGGRTAFTWAWSQAREPADPLRPIAHAALELLTSGPLDRVKTCGNCRWLFLDKSRNHSRRWCSMNECGTQLKHRRFVERRRAARPE